jgi:quinol monooxygenase YgiN
MSTIVALFDLGSTSAQYEQVMRDLEAAGAGKPKGRLYHVAAPDNGRWLVIDVWESGEALNQFAQTLMPILQKAGVQANPPKTYPVHNIIPG